MEEIIGNIKFVNSVYFTIFITPIYTYKLFYFLSYKLPVIANTFPTNLFRYFRHNTKQKKRLILEAIATPKLNIAFC